MSSRCSRRLPWAKLMRATFIPARTRPVSTFTGREAGPIVHTIFVAIENLLSTAVPPEESQFHPINELPHEQKRWSCHLNLRGQKKLFPWQFQPSIHHSDIAPYD